MAKNKNQIWNIIGIGLGILGIYQLFKGATPLWAWLLIAIIGAIVYGGLPKKINPESLIKASPVYIISSLAVILFYIKQFGENTAWQDAVGIIFGVIVGAVLVSIFKRLTKN